LFDFCFCRIRSVDNRSAPMSACIASLASVGVEPRIVDVRVKIASGAAGFYVVGLADKAVAESRERGRPAFASIGLV
jgi:magnesium chelatase family protein